MTSARATDRFFIDLLDLDSLPRPVRPAFLEWARALDQLSNVALESPSDSPELPSPEFADIESRRFDAHVRLEAARRHALRVSERQDVENDPRVLDAMLYLSLNFSDRDGIRSEPRSLGQFSPTDLANHPDRPARPDGPDRSLPSDQRHRDDRPE